MAHLDARGLRPVALKLWVWDVTVKCVIDEVIKKVKVWELEGAVSM